MGPRWSADPLAGSLAADVAVTASDADVRELERNEDVVARLLEIADARCAAARYESAIEWCRIAASYAMTNATGRLRSTRMESVLDRIAAGALQPSAAVPTRAGRRRVLHVLTEAAEVGGLTRLAQRWMARDEGSASCVALTRQGVVAPALVAATARSGGWAVALGDEHALTRAARLRALAADVDIVICHLQPDDPVAAVAFGAGYSGAPVAVFDHADHLSWIAPTRASLIVDFRPIGAKLTAVGRGYPSHNVAELPLLVPGAPPDDSRSRVRARLGVADTEVLMVTVARAIKFHDTTIRPTFGDLVAAALDADPRITLCVVGAAGDDGPWPGLGSRYPGRIHAVGPTPDPHPYLAAGDVYLDPFPFSSLTSLLEASAAGLPVLTFDGHHGLRAALGIADFVGGEDDRPRTVADLAHRVRRLAADPQARRAAGARARETFEALSPEEAWRSRLEHLYRRMQGGHSVPVGVAPVPEPDAALIDYGAALLAVEQRIPLLWTVTAGIPHFDRQDRLRWRARTLAARVARVVGRGDDSSIALLLGKRVGR